MKTVKVTARVKKDKPKRSYRAVIESLRQVWQIERVGDADAIWQLGEPEMAAFPADAIRIAIWNLCKGAGGVLFENDYRALCYRSDMILTQEALLSKNSLKMFCESGWQTIHAASYVRRDGLRDGVMTASRVRAEPPTLRVVCKYPEPIFRTPKVALVKFFPISGTHERLMVVNLHATLVRLKAGAIEEMEHLVAHLPAHHGPMILAGDFNTFLPGYLRAIGLVLARIGLRYVRIPNDPRPPTQALDQVFVRGLDITDIHVDTSVRNSDHFPILLRASHRG